MQTDTPRNAHPERPDIPAHTSFVLTFLADDEGRTTPDEIAALLRERAILGAVVDGADLGTPGASVAIVAVDDDGRVLLDAEGRVVPGQQIEHLVPGLAHRTGRRVVVDDEVVIGPDGSESEPDDDALDATTATTLVAWRASVSSPVYVRAVAQALGCAVEHATVDGWTLVALPPGRTLDAQSFARSAVGAGERPVVTFQRAGESRAVTWHHRDGRHDVTLELSAAARTTTVVPHGAAGSSAATLAAMLGDGTLREVPDTRRLDRATLTALRAVPLERATLLRDAAAALALPPVFAEVVEHAGSAARDERPAVPARWLDVPGATVVEPGRTVGSAAVRGLREVLLDEPQGSTVYARFRRWLWHRPGTLVTLSVLGTALGCALGVWAAQGGEVFGQGWPVWVAAVALVIDGVPDLLAGVALLRRRQQG